MPGTAPSPTPASRYAEKRVVAYIVLGLIVAVLCAYAQIVRADFIHYDDNSHVFENPLVLGGLNWSGIREAFRPGASLWIPLTWLSFMADISIFGLNPGAMHAVNLAWHIASTVLLFLTLWRMTGALWASAFVAGLFGLHPINVESVAWVTERKNVLHTFFWIAALAAYVRYAEKPGARAYLATFLFTACALLSKPMAVTLPCTLLLLDFWPLNRLRSVSWGRLLGEKLPLFALSAVAAGMAMLSRREASVVTMETLSMAARLSNALVSYVTYLGDFLWPTKLAIFYPHPVEPQMFAAAGALAVLLVITGLALWQCKARPYLLMGWLWFLGTLVPVIGLVQVGSQARADRFTYLPQLGIFLAVTWLIKEHAHRVACLGRVLGGALLIACALLTSRQVGFWLDGTTLFEHALTVTKNNACAEANAGLHRALAGDDEKAIPHYQASLQIQPDQSMIWREFGGALLRLGKNPEAVQALRTGLKYAPDDIAARYQLGVALLACGAIDEGLAHFEKLVADVPHSAGSHFHIALALESRGRVEEARAHLRRATELAPTDPQIAAAARRLAAPAEKGAPKAL